MHQLKKDDTLLSPLDIELILACAADYITLKRAKELIKLGAKPDKIHPDSGNAAIHYLAQSQSKEIASEVMDFLINKAKANPDLKSKDGMTPLIYASYCNNPHMVRLLVDTRKVDVNYKNTINDLNDTPLSGLIFNYNLDIARTLLEAGADPEQKNIDGKTLMEEAEESGIIELVDLVDEFRFLNSNSSNITLYDKKNIEQMLNEINSDESPLIPHLENLLKRDSRRTMELINRESIDKLELLKDRFPNFIGVIDYVVEQASLSLLSEQPYFSMPPVLMVGGAGVGKTRFTKELSNALNIEFMKVDGGNTTGSQSLGGMDSVWRDAKPGKVCEHLKRSKNANPIVMVDEIDKMISSSHSDPYGPLYSLLEKETAKEFIDDFYKTPFNCSNIIWFATANEINTIPEPILSRFYVIKVPEPTKEQMPQIIKSVYDDIVSSDENPWGSRFSSSLSESIIKSLESQEPRKLKRSILAAMGFVARKISKNNINKNEKIKLSISDFNDSRLVTKKQFGFS